MSQAQNIFFALCVAWAMIGIVIFLVSLDQYLEEGRSMLVAGGLTGGLSCPPMALFGFLIFRDWFLKN